MNDFRKLSIKTQALGIIEFMIGYFSPLVGVIIAIFMVRRKKEKIYIVFPLLGAVIAIIFYLVGFLLNLLQ